MNFNVYRDNNSYFPLTFINTWYKFKIKSLKVIISYIFQLIQWNEYSFVFLLFYLHSITLTEYI